MTNNICVTRLYLGGNQIDDKCIVDIGDYIRYNRNIVSLSLGMLVSDDGIISLCSFIDKNTSLNEISLQHNPGITDKSIPKLRDIIFHSQLTVVDVNNTSISQEKQLMIARLRNKLIKGLKSVHLNRVWVIITISYAFCSDA